MNNVHTLTLIAPPSADDDKCRSLIVDRMLALFPDAIIHGPPIIDSSLGMMKLVTASFESPAYDASAAHERELLTEEMDWPYRTSTVAAIGARLRKMFTRGKRK